jgi:hypothetical protein
MSRVRLERWRESLAQSMAPQNTQRGAHEGLGSDNNVDRSGRTFTRVPWFVLNKTAMVFNKQEIHYVKDR